MNQKALPHANGLIRLLIADDHELARIGIRSMLSSERWIEIVGEASNGREAVELCHQLAPDIALLDVRMPEMDGLAATRAIKQVHPQISVLIVTTHEQPDYLVAALKAGAAGYILKDVTHQDLIRAIRQVLRGEAILNGEMAAQALRRLASDPATMRATPPERLTARELSVLRLIAQGRTNREIASALMLSVGTIKIHVEHIIAKLGVSDRTQAAVRAIELGLFDRT